MGDTLLEACEHVFLSPRVPLIVLVTAAYGVFMGAVPGLTATMAVSLLIPVITKAEKHAATTSRRLVCIVDVLPHFERSSITCAGTEPRKC